VPQQFTTADLARFGFHPIGFWEMLRKMPIFESEFLKALDEHDSLVRQCLAGAIGFGEFCDQYDSFYWRYALDGHESDQAERGLFDRYRARVELHRVIAHEILTKVCSDADTELDSYKSAERFGPIEAVKRLRRLVTVADDVLLLSR